MLLAYYFYTAWIPKHTCIVWILPEYSINNAWNLSNHHLKTAWILPWYNDSFVNSIKHRVEPDIAVCRPTDLKFVDGVDQKFLILVFLRKQATTSPGGGPDPSPCYSVFYHIQYYSLLFYVILYYSTMSHVIACYCVLLHTIACVWVFIQ